MTRLLNIRSDATALHCLSVAVVSWQLSDSVADEIESYSVLVVDYLYYSCLSGLCMSFSAVPSVL